MIATYLVELDVDDPSQIMTIAEDIQDDLISAGHLITSVKPWARPTLNFQPQPPQPPS